MSEIERAVFELIEEYNGARLPGLQPYRLELDTDLNDDFRMSAEDAYEMLERYAERFNIGPATINFSHYFPENFDEKHEPLTPRLMSDSASAGCWLGKK